MVVAVGDVAAVVAVATAALLVSHCQWKGGRQHTVAAVVALVAVAAAVVVVAAAAVAVVVVG